MTLPSGDRRIAKRGRGMLPDQAPSLPTILSLAQDVARLYECVGHAGRLILPSSSVPNRVLCQNCVTCPPKPRSNTVTYGDTPMHIVVVGSRWWELR